MINSQIIIEDLPLIAQQSTEDLIIILGPTASGKTKLAVQLAEQIDAEIISVDSRQVYCSMNIGTGKDLADYKTIPYHLIDIVDPGQKYNISQFLTDFERAFNQIVARGKKVIACGGTGFYLQTLLQEKPYTTIPVDDNFRNSLANISKPDLISMLSLYNQEPGLQIDITSSKRLIRGLEILHYISKNPDEIFPKNRTYSAKIIGLNPAVEVRRERISTRLYDRMEAGLIEEVRTLLDSGLSYADLEYYGLEYKYISFFIKGDLDYKACFDKLETEIHRYAKRQMTYFRKMEKDGIAINWLQ